MKASLAAVGLSNDLVISQKSPSSRIRIWGNYAEPVTAKRRATFILLFLIKCIWQQSDGQNISASDKCLRAKEDLAK
jgi:hypothetical protein